MGGFWTRTGTAPCWKALPLEDKNEMKICSRDAALGTGSVGFGHQRERRESHITARHGDQEIDL